MRGSLWEVTYTFEPAIPCKGGPVDFADAGLRLAIADSHITGAQHRVEAAIEASREDVLRYSRESLDCFLAALRFLQLTQVYWWADASRIDPPESGLRLQVRASGTVGSRAVVVPGEGWLGDESARLAAWLYLAAEAQETPSPATAIRLYFLIVEELSDLEALADDSTELILCLKAIRDFVSHPVIDKPRTMERLRACAFPLTEGRDAFRYRPSSTVQRAVLDEFRMKARKLVDSYLHKRLGVHEVYWPTAS
ncbi:MAG: hypothetical protein M3P26_16105 [Gemmatimonadota bacterium]|nr:hypothetical protein [Gemmatimonadota bacterium]